MKQPLKPEATLLCKLGSIVIHAEEMLSNKGHSFDVKALKGLLEDEEVQEWLKEMDRLVLLPKKR